MSDDQKYFVNRHGKKSGISGAVEEIASTERETPKIDTKPKKPRKQWKLPTIRVFKKIALIIAVILVVTLAALVILADTARRDLERDASRMQTSIEEIAPRTVSPETSASAAAEGLLTQPDADTTCSSGLADVVRSVYSPAKNAYEACKANAAHYESIRNDLTTLRSVAEYLESQNEILSTAVALPSDGAFAEIAAQAEVWSNANEAIKRLTPPELVKDTHAESVKKVSAIADGWAKLSSANADQNQQDFSDAETELSAGYESLRASGSELDSVVANLQKSIDESVSRLVRTEQ